MAYAMNCADGNTNSRLRSDKSWANLTRIRLKQFGPVYSMRSMSSLALFSSPKAPCEILESTTSV